MLLPLGLRLRWMRLWRLLDDVAIKLPGDHRSPLRECEQSSINALRWFGLWPHSRRDELRSSVLFNLLE